MPASLLPYTHPNEHLPEIRWYTIPDTKEPGHTVRSLRYNTSQ